ncbi:MAG: single-stranded DNA-binding protein [Lactobacillales bacterium]|jgi:single-strand DNA-binding protein|nr:single-stranded DNA-binding protein [Lactobacillales bacterium]
MINNVVIVGRLTRDLDIKTSGSGMTVGRFSLAVDASRKNANGERHTNFINCVAFGKAAELINQYMKKGSQLGVTGELRTGSYQNQQGNTVYTTDVVVNEFQFLDSRNSNSGSAPASGGFAPQSAPAPTQSTGFNQPAPQSNNFNAGDHNLSGGFSTPVDNVDFSDDDLPF